MVSFNHFWQKYSKLDFSFIKEKTIKKAHATSKKANGAGNFEWNLDKLFKFCVLCNTIAAISRDLYLAKRFASYILSIKSWVRQTKLWLRVVFQIVALYAKHKIARNWHAKIQFGWGPLWSHTACKIGVNFYFIYFCGVKSVVRFWPFGTCKCAHHYDTKEPIISICGPQYKC